MDEETIAFEAIIETAIGLFETGAISKEQLKEILDACRAENNDEKDRA